jgi:hypothetical protein
MEINSVVVYDAFGKEVGKSANIQINLSCVSAGVYLINIRFNEASQNIKIVKL